MMAKRKRLTPTLLPDAPAPSAKVSDPSRRSLRAPIADVARDASTQSALEEMAQSIADARAKGRMVLQIPLEEVQQSYLVRDRVTADDAEMAALKASLSSRGQQAPIEVVALESGGYGLISGWRRCQALIQLRAETEDVKFDTVLALLRRPEDASEAYLAMVEENEIRVGLSYYERARIAAKAVEQGVYDTRKTALQQLYANASRAKRSKIGSFLTIVEELDGVLRFPSHLHERLGLSLARALTENSGLGARLRRGLEQAAPATPEAEVAYLSKALSEGRTTSRKGIKARGKQALNSHLETNLASGTLSPRDGISVRLLPEGGAVIEGDAFDEGLRQRLLAWLAQVPE